MLVVDASSRIFGVLSFLGLVLHWHWNMLLERNEWSRKHHAYAVVLNRCSFFNITQPWAWGCRNWQWGDIGVAAANDCRCRFIVDSCSAQCSAHCLVLQLLRRFFHNLVMKLLRCFFRNTIALFFFLFRSNLGIYFAFEVFSALLTILVLGRVSIFKKSRIWKVLC